MYISKFKTNEAYSNIDINEITEVLTGSGIVPDAPCEVLQNYAEAGVTVQNERCAVTWHDAEKTKVRIGSGIAIAGDGSYIIISGGEILEVSDDEKHYVFIENDDVLQNVPRCGKTLPSDSVLLAEVQNGEIRDRRTMAKSKIEGFGYPQPETLIEAVRLNAGTSAFPLSSADHKYIILYDLLNEGTCRGIGVWDIEADTYVYHTGQVNNLRMSRAGADHIEIEHGNETESVTFDITGMKLYVTATRFIEICTILAI